MVRAIVPQEGLGVMRERRGPAGEGHLTDGPGKLCLALAIDLTLNGTDLTQEGALAVEVGPGVPEAEVKVTSRVGVRGDEETRRRPWRFLWPG